MKRFLSIIVPAALLLQGCAVLEPVGSFFAQGYRNTVAYFNAYYNASRLFSEAEDEYLKAYRTYLEALRDGPPTEFRVPPAAAQKFNAVIDKCSNILTFQAKSDYVQDALFLIARSYDYLGESVKAERKYAELLAQYPDSDYRTEAVARLGNVLAEQGRRDEALVLLEQAEKEATAEEDDDVLAFVLEMLASLHKEAGDVDLAHSYYARLQALAGSDERHLRSLVEFARLQLETGEPSKALQIAANLAGLTDDPFYLYDARLVEIAALKKLGRPEDALARVEETLDDFRFLQQQGSVMLLRADLLYEAGREAEAVDAYVRVDTTFAKRVPGARAAFALGRIYTGRGEYEQARLAFERGSTVAAAPITADARRLTIALRSYIGLQERFWKTDSILTALRDSSSGAADARIDSMETLLSTVMQEMGDWHFEQWEQMDSASVWLSRALATGKPRPAKARALFVLADIAAAGGHAGLSAPEDYYRRIIAEYPTSAYAEESRVRLGLPQERQTDPGLEVYARAESILDKGDPALAARVFDSVSIRYPASAYALRGTYASGWVYDYFLARDDSAAARYTKVVRSGSALPIVQEARTRLNAITTRTRDTTAVRPAVPDTSAARQTTAPPQSEGEVGPDRRPPNREQD